MVSWYCGTRSIHHYLIKLQCNSYKIICTWRILILYPTSSKEFTASLFCVSLNVFVCLLSFHVLPFDTNTKNMKEKWSRRYMVLILNSLIPVFYETPCIYFFFVLKSMLYLCNYVKIFSSDQAKLAKQCLRNTSFIIYIFSN